MCALQDAGHGHLGRLKLKHDFGTPFVSRALQAESRFLGMEGSPSFVRSPEGNGCIERFWHTLKAHLLWIRTFKDIDELNREFQALRDRYNRRGPIERHGQRTRTWTRQNFLAKVRWHEYTQPRSRISRAVQPDERHPRCKLSHPHLHYTHAGDATGKRNKKAFCKRQKELQGVHSRQSFGFRLTFIPLVVGFTALRREVRRAQRASRKDLKILCIGIKTIAFEIQPISHGVSTILQKICDNGRRPLHPLIHFCPVLRAAHRHAV